MTRSGTRWLTATAEIVILGALLAVSFTVASGFLSTSGAKTIVEWELAPAVVVACGGGFERPELESAALQAFLLRQADAVTCADAAGPTVAPLPIARTERYSIYAAGLAMRLGGLSWRTLDRYFGFVFALTMLLAFGIFRLVSGPWLAAAGVVALVWSTQVVALLSFRDFGKQPAFFALWLGLGWMIKRGLEGNSARLLLPAAVMGAALGIGLGFRVDVLVFLPIVAGVLAVIVPRFDRAELQAKAVALGVFLIAFLATGWPLLGSMSEGSNGAHVAALGLMSPYTRELGLDQPPYDIGDTHSDEFVRLTIATHAGLVQGDDRPVFLGSPAYDAVGAGYLADVARHFPADMLIRGLSATAQVIASPFEEASRQGYLYVVPFSASPSFQAIGEWRAAVLKPLEGKALWLAALVFALVFRRNWRLGLLGALLVLYFSGYSMLQFSRRHTFHLDVIGIGLALVSVRLIADWVRPWVPRATGPAPEDRSAPGWSGRGVVIVVCLVAALGGTLVATRWWQQRHVRGLIEQTLAANWDDAHAVAEPLTDSMMADGQPRPTWRAVPGFNVDRWAPGVLFRVPRPTGATRALLSRNALQSEYLRLDLSAQCSTATVSIVAAYSGSEATLQREYSRLYEVPVEPGSTASHLLLPVFYVDGAEWTNFDGLAVPGGQAACVTAIYRAPAPQRMPLPLLNAVLTPGWRDTTWYQRRR